MCALSGAWWCGCRMGLASAASLELQAKGLTLRPISAGPGHAPLTACCRRPFGGRGAPRTVSSPSRPPRLPSPVMNDAVITSLRIAHQSMLSSSRITRGEPAIIARATGRMRIGKSASPLRIDFMGSNGFVSITRASPDEARCSLPAPARAAPGPSDSTASFSRVPMDEPDGVHPVAPHLGQREGLAVKHRSHPATVRASPARPDGSTSLPAPLSPVISSLRPRHGSIHADRTAELRQVGSLGQALADPVLAPRAQSVSMSGSLSRRLASARASLRARAASRARLRAVSGSATRIRLLRLCAREELSRRLGRA